MKKRFSFIKFITYFFLLPIFLCGFISPVFSQTSQVSVEVVSCGQPVLDSEPAFTVGLENTINWNTADLAVEYYAEISEESDFSIIYANSGWITQLTYTFDFLNDDTKYYYRVKARNVDDTEGNWSDTVFSTQDDNAPTSNVQDLEEITSLEFVTLEITSFDQTSGIDSITLLYRKDGGVWTVYGEYEDITEIIFDSLLTGGDGYYEFYTIAKDIVGNNEYEVAHTDSFTTIDTTVPPQPEPEPEPEPIPEPEPSPVEPVEENYVFINSIDSINVRNQESLSIYNTSPKVEGYSQPLRKVYWSVYYSDGSFLIEENYIRADENGFWSIQLPELDFSEYEIEVYFVENGVRYSDSLILTIEESVLFEISGFTTPDSAISVFYNNTWFEIGKSNDEGSFSLEFEVPYSFTGEIIFKSSKEEYFSTIIKDYSFGTTFENIIFPPMLYPSVQSVPLNQFAQINGYAVPKSQVNIYVNGEFYESVLADLEGKFSLHIGKFVELKQFEITATQHIEDLESEKSSAIYIYIHRHGIPYIHTVGSLVGKHIGQIAEYAILISEILVITGLFMTVLSGLILASASTISGYYNLIHDWRSLFAFIKPSSLIRVQIAGVDLGNKEGLLYLSNPSDNKVVVRVWIDSKGVGYLNQISGIFNACYIATKNRSWFMSAIWRKSFIDAYMLDQVVIKSDLNNLNLAFEHRESLFIYPFVKFERWFDRILLFIVLPISIFTTIASIISFYFVASYSALILIIVGIILVTLNILMIGYKKTFLNQIKWDGY